MTRDATKELYLCRASGESSHAFRVAADEAGVMTFYEEMFGRDSDGKMDSAIEHFRDTNNWSYEGTAYSCELYYAQFEVWKVHPRQLLLPSEIGIGWKPGDPRIVCATAARPDRRATEEKEMTIELDVLTLCLRLCLEPADSHSPDTRAVLERYRPAWEAMAGGTTFEDAWQLLPAQQPDTVCAPGWVPVSERLPNSGQRVLLVTNGEIRTGLYETPRLPQQPGFDWPGVTHWMQLPAAPKDVQT